MRNAQFCAPMNIICSLSNHFIISPYAVSGLQNSQQCFFFFFARDFRRQTMSLTCRYKKGHEIR